MILQAITQILSIVSGIVTNMGSLMLDEYVSLLTFVLVCVVIIIVIRIIGGLIRHNGNSG